MEVQLLNQLIKLRVATLNPRHQPTFHLIPYLNKHYFEKSFWANRFQPFIFNRLMQDHSEKTPTRRHIDIGILVCCVHFPEVFNDMNDPFFMKFDSLWKYADKANDPKSMSKIIEGLDPLMWHTYSYIEQSKKARTLINELFGKPTVEELSKVREANTLVRTLIITSQSDLVV
ncbi:MAG: hypothetical protein KBC22_01780 [Candidatus Pacebacteria bacterium]|nr:hypothetical protein [Candidatus Paceibacterota bacterium]